MIIVGSTSLPKDNLTHPELSSTSLTRSSSMVTPHSLGSHNTLRDHMMVEGGLGTTIFRS